MPRRVRPLSPGSLLLAFGLLGLGAGGAAASVRLVSSNQLKAVAVAPVPSRGATIRTVTPGQVEVLERVEPFTVASRQFYLTGCELSDTSFDATCLSEPADGELRVNDVSDRKVGDFAVLPPQYFPAGYAALHGFLARNVGPVRPYLYDPRAGGSAVFGRRDFVCAPWEEGFEECLAGAPDVRDLPLDPEVLLGLPPGSLRSPGFDPIVFDPEAVSTSWLTLLYLASRSCAGVDDPACFDASAPLREGACSFNEPMLCAGLDGFEAPWTAVAVDLDRMRVKERAGRAKLRVKGRIGMEEAAQDGGVFSVAVGDMTASIPLDAFEKRGRRRVWRGDAEGLRRVVLGDDGSFQILARDIASELLEGEPLPLLVQIGGALAATGVPLD